MNQNRQTVFQNIVFKLLVVGELMYGQKVLEPFKLAVVEQLTGKTLYKDANWVMPKDNFYGIMPEIQTYFEQYELTSEMLTKVERISFDGSNQIAGDVAPYWDGEDDLFNLTVEWAQDLHLLPNLKQVNAIYDMNDATIAQAFLEKEVTLTHAFE